MARSGRITDRQKELLINYMWENREFAVGGFLNDEGKQTARRMWVELAGHLNSDRDGPAKTIDQWHKCWQDLRLRAKARGQELRNYMAGTGGGDAPGRDAKAPKPLTTTEEVIISIIGDEVTYGLDDVRESGDKSRGSHKQQKENEDEIISLPGTSGGKGNGSEGLLFDVESTGQKPCGSQTSRNITSSNKQQKENEDEIISLPGTSGGKGNGSEGLLFDVESTGQKPCGSQTSRNITSSNKQQKAMSNCTLKRPRKEETNEQKGSKKYTRKAFYELQETNNIHAENIFLALHRLADTVESFKK